MDPLDADSFHGPLDRSVDRSMRPRNTDLDEWPARYTRSPSPTESFSDSPSVYSHAYTSPHLADPPQGRRVAPHFHYDSRPPTQDFNSRSPTPHCDGLGPAASLLDFDDDSAPPTDSVQSTLTDTDEASVLDEDVSDHRMSLNGPKIRFHSKAPWETGEDSILEDEDADQATTSGVFSKFHKGKIEKTDAIKRTFGRGIAAVNRTSHESSRSHPDKRSLEADHSSQSPQKAFFSMPQGGMSSGSLALPPSASSYQTSFPNRIRQYTPVSIHSNRHRAHEASRPATSSGAPNHANLTTRDTPPSPVSDRNRSPAARSSTPSSQYSSLDDTTQEVFVHPYAHPDLVSRHPDYSTFETSSTGPVGSMPRSNSIATVTDTVSSSRSAILSATTTETSSSSLPPSNNIHVRARNISGPLSVVHTNDPSVVKGPQARGMKLSIYPPPTKGTSDWSQPMSPTVTLISLEEAQARERARSANPANTAGNSRSHLSEGDDSASTSYAISSSNPSGDARTRARSTSAGAHNKTLLSPARPSPMPVKPERRGSEPAVVVAQAGDARGLKHKKSGFMRLFNGREKDKSIPPPPVPYPPNLRPEQESQRGNIPKSTRLVLPRVPVPPLTPTLPPDLSRSDDLDDREFSEPHIASPSRKHSAPSLYIDTASAAVGMNSTGRPHTTSSSMLAVPTSQGGPQSAPPGTTDFPSLKLRPVSTSFSSHFASIVSTPEATEQEFDFDPLDTPNSAPSPGAAMSPVTPSGGDDQLTSSAIGEKSVVKALQEQIVSAKRAWQQQKMELESHVRELQAEVDALHSLDQGYCEHCGRGSDSDGPRSASDESKKMGIINRPRARTGDYNTTRFASRQ